MQTINHVGFVAHNPDDQTTKSRRPVFVIWFDDYVKPLSLLIPREMSCIFCGNKIELPDFRGTSLSNPEVFEFKYGCNECWTHYIFNKAPKELREKLSWPEYVKEREI